MINVLQRCQLKIMGDKLTNKYLEHINQTYIDQLITTIYPQEDDKCQQLKNALQLLRQINSMNPEEILQSQIIEILYEAITRDKRQDECFNDILQQNIIGFQSLIGIVQNIMHYVSTNQQNTDMWTSGYVQIWYNKLINILQYISLQYFTSLMELTYSTTYFYKTIYSYPFNTQDERQFSQLKTNSFQRLVEFIYNVFLFDPDLNYDTGNRIVQLIDLQNIAIGGNLELFNNMDPLQNALFNMTNNEILYSNFYIIGLIVSQYLQLNVNNNKYVIDVKVAQMINQNTVMQQLVQFFFLHMDIYRQIKKDLYQLDEIFYSNDQSQMEDFEKYKHLKNTFKDRFSKYHDDLPTYEFKQMMEQFTLLVERTYLSAFIEKNHLIKIMSYSFENDLKYYEKISKNIFSFVFIIVATQYNIFTENTWKDQLISTLQEIFVFCLQQIQFQVNTTLQNQYTCKQIHMNTLDLMSFIIRIFIENNVIITMFEYESLAHLISTYFSFITENSNNISIMEILDITLFLYQQQQFQDPNNYLFYTKTNMAFYNAMHNPNVQKFLRDIENEQYYNKCQFIFEQLRDMQLLTPDMLANLLYLDKLVSTLFSQMSQNAWDQNMETISLYNH